MTVARCRIITAKIQQQRRQQQQQQSIYRIISIALLQNCTHTHIYVAMQNIVQQNIITFVICLWRI